MLLVMGGCARVFAPLFDTKRMEGRESRLGSYRCWVQRGRLCTLLDVSVACGM